MPTHHQRRGERDIFQRDVRERAHHPMHHLAHGEGIGGKRQRKRRQRGRETRDRNARQHKRRDARAGPRQEIKNSGGGERTEDREDRQQQRAECRKAEIEREGRAQSRRRCDAGNARLGERIAEKTLERRAACAERRTDKTRQQRTRQPYLARDHAGRTMRRHQSGEQLSGRKMGRSDQERKTSEQNHSGGQQRRHGIVRSARLALLQGMYPGRRGGTLTVRRAPVQARALSPAPAPAAAQRLPTTGRDTRALSAKPARWPSVSASRKPDDAGRDWRETDADRRRSREAIAADRRRPPRPGSCPNASYPISPATSTSPARRRISSVTGPELT